MLTNYEYNSYNLKSSKTFILKIVAKISKKLLAVIEPKPYIRNSMLNNDIIAKNYFKKVKQSELKKFLKKLFNRK